MSECQALIIFLYKLLTLLYNNCLRGDFLKKYLSLLRRLITYYILWRLAFVLGCFRPVNRHLAVFAYNKNYSSLPDNLLCIKKEFEKAGWQCVEYSSPQSASERYLSDIKFQFLYSKSQIVFLSDNFDPVCAHKPRKDSRVVQLWHGCGAFKKFGYSTLESQWGGNKTEWKLFPRHNTYTDVFVSSAKVIPCYAEAFNCAESIIKPLGVPRTDVFFDKKFISDGKAELERAIPEIRGRKIILYAPTFRGDNPDEAYNDNNIDFEKFRILSEKCVIILKYHPFTAKKENFTAEQKEKYGDFVYLCPDNIGINTALCSADMVISDYSSLVFEYSLMNRPMIFFAYDLKQYNNSRSCYYKYEDFVPGPVVKSDDELIDIILSGVSMKKIADFRKDFMSSCDGESSRRIAEYLINGIQN